MKDRESAVQHARVRLERWEQKHERLLAGPAWQTSRGNRVVEQATQELSDRLERARLKFELLRRAEDPTSAEVSDEFERSLSELQAAWDAAVTRMGSTRVLPSS